ncbi:MAG: ATP-dependent RecD-like DNA helicase [Clostridia bacterium]|nr:ATP-dependent RecD-like DNA helicase [Clostridia bacterium]
MKEEKAGQISELIFTNESTFYAVLLFETEEEQFFAVGSMPNPRLGRTYKLTGEWKNHPKYGEQFAFSSFEEIMPSGADAIRAFLSSGIIHGIGPISARAIVKKFGDDTLRIIEEEPERLAEVNGIGKSKANAIAEGYAAQRIFANVVMDLSKLGIETPVALKLFRQYGASAVDIVKENPYRLIEDVYGIGFMRADKIAASIGIENDSPFRIKSGIVYALESKASGGDTYYPEKELIEQVAQFLDVTREQVAELELELALDGTVYKENLNGEIILMLHRFRRAENFCASKLSLLCNCYLTGIAGNLEKMIASTEKSSGIKLSPTQKNAVISTFKNGVSVITGGPGTGKTTIINTILAILKNEGIKTALAAPTGRAAKRMSQATGEEALTIHRLLEYGASEDSQNLFFNKNDENPIDAGCIIIDEASMVDILLLEALLRAIKTGTRLILVGDADQLPSVGAGNVLSDIISSEMIHCVRLTDIFRQAQESMIVVNAHLINKGEYPSYNQKDTDFFFLNRSSEAEIVETIKQLVKYRLPAFYEKEGKDVDIQVLTPTRKGPCGTAELNKMLQGALNPNDGFKNEKIIDNRIYREGDRVMQNKNDYTIEWKNIYTLEPGKGVFNGDIGVIKSIDTENGIINVLYDDVKLVSYDYMTADEIESAFAMTVHKSQGSEFAVVVMPMAHFPPMLSTRNLFYTAVTRAKLGVVLVGDERIARAMTDNDFSAKRYSGLSERLKKIWEES